MCIVIVTLQNFYKVCYSVCLFACLQHNSKLFHGNFQWASELLHGRTDSNLGINGSVSLILQQFFGYRNQHESLTAVIWAWRKWDLSGNALQRKFCKVCSQLHPPSALFVCLLMSIVLLVFGMRLYIFRDFLIISATIGAIYAP